MAPLPVAALTSAQQSTVARAIGEHPWRWIIATAGAASIIATAITSSLDIWGRVEGHWQTKEEATRYEKANNSRDEQQDRRIELLILQTRLAATLLRAELLEDRNFDCAVRRAKLSAFDTSICDRYATQYKQTIDRAEILQRQIEAQQKGVGQ